MSGGKARKVLYGFHAVGVRLKVAPQSVREVLFDPSRRDKRMQMFLLRAQQAGAKSSEADAARLQGLCGTHHHQGVVAVVDDLPAARSLDDVLDAAQGPPLVLLLDGVTDPHNLGAVLRTADGAGVHAVVAPKDRACGINATVAKVASGAAETVPYFMVTNLARTMDELKERGIWCLGTTGDAPAPLFGAQLARPLALVLGSEGEGMRRLTRERCDELVHIPMRGAVESLNVSVAAAVCLYEAVRQRGVS
jgi:23S rRNA (guanosine2251-2'-O)-methyltransferase